MRTARGRFAPRRLRRIETDVSADSHSCSGRSSGARRSRVTGVIDMDSGLFSALIVI
jgi:hypothetical protein